MIFVELIDFSKNNGMTIYFGMAQVLTGQSIDKALSAVLAAADVLIV